MNTQIDNYLEIFHTLDFEKIKDHPNILIAANFWEEERYRAAKTCYKFMRCIDDLIDNYKADHTQITADEKQRFISDVDNWISAYKKSISDHPLNKELTETLEKFRIPQWTMENFARSMVYDIHNDGFSSLEVFLDYTKGASIAPASIFVHLCGVNKANGSYTPPLYDVGKAASPCAVFSYLVHIIRDFQKDQLNNLNYFADDLIDKHGLTRRQLRQMAEGGKITDGFREMIKEYYLLANEYRQKTYDMILKIRPYLEPRYQLSLEIIFNLYLMVFERIDVKTGNFTTDELNPTYEEIKNRVYLTIIGFMKDAI